jgi:hypothetical protein
VAAREDFNVLPVIHFEVDKPGRAIFLVKSKSVFIPEQTAIEGLGLREVAHLKSDVRNAHQGWAIRGRC